ncbi:MAG: adenylate/guanylate cyclase domain-containing protein [Salaquimonas sp.]
MRLVKFNDAKVRVLIGTLKAFSDWVLRAGISGYSREDRRRLSLVNLAGYLAALSSLSYAINFALHDYQNLMPLIIGNCASAIITATAPFWHRYNSVFSATVLTVTVSLSLFYFVSLLGTDSGIHLNYIGGAAIGFAIFGIRHMRVIWTIGIICITANIAAELLFETGSLQNFIDPGFMKQLYALSAISIIVIVTLIVWYGFSIAADAEKRSEQLLLNIFPPRIADELRYNPDISIADRFDETTVMFADIVGFTEMSSAMDPDDLVALLNEIFTEFDALATKHHAEKIKTIGDEYMAVCGAPDPVENHAERILDLAVDMLEASKRLSVSTGYELKLRVGVATGPITAGVIGKTKFAYDVWATTVNIASRLVSTCPIGGIHVTGATHIATRDKFSFKKAPKVNLKGIAFQQTWYLDCK